MDNMAALAGISVLAGFLGSLIGLGGAAMLIPILVLIGVPVKEAIASAMVVIIATSSGSAASYVKQRIANILLPPLFALEIRVNNSVVSFELRYSFIFSSPSSFLLQQKLIKVFWKKSFYRILPPSREEAGAEFRDRTAAVEERHLR